MLPRACKVILKSLQIFEISSHLGAEMTDFDKRVPLVFSHNLVYFSQLVYKWPS